MAVSDPGFDCGIHNFIFGFVETPIANWFQNARQLLKGARACGWISGVWTSGRMIVRSSVTGSHY